MTRRGDSLLSRVDADWRPLAEAVKALDPRQLTAPLPSGWIAAEMLAHVAFWDEAVVPVVTTMFRGGALPQGWAFGSGYEPAGAWPPPEVHNAREAAWARTIALKTVLARLASAHAQLEDLLVTVTDAEGLAKAGYFDGISAHYREHLPELLALASPAG